MLHTSFANPSHIPQSSYHPSSRGGHAPSTSTFAPQHPVRVLSTTYIPLDDQKHQPQQRDLSTARMAPGVEIKGLETLHFDNLLKLLPIKENKIIEEGFQHVIHPEDTPDQPCLMFFKK